MGPHGPTPPPPPGGGFPPPGGGFPPSPAPKRKSKLPLVLALGVLGVVVVAVLAVVGLTVVGGDEPEPGSAMVETGQATVEAAEARAAVATAVADSDTDALTTLATDAPDALADATEATPGEPATAELNDVGYAVFTIDAVSGAAYTVTAEVAEGDADVTSAVIPEGAPAVAPADAFDATVDGAHRVVVAAGSAAEGEVTVTVKEVEIIPVDLSEPGSVQDELAEPGDAVAYEFDAEAGSHYVVDIDTAELTVTVNDADGGALTTVPDIELGTPRFVAETTGPHRVTIGGGREGATGAFEVEIFEVSEFFFYYDGEAGNDLVLERTTEQFEAPVDQAEQRAHFCLFLREGIRMNLDIRVTTPTLDIGIDVFDETDQGDLIARVNDLGPGGTEVWAVTAQRDVRRCFQLWGVAFSTGTFVISFTTEG